MNFDGRRPSDAVPIAGGIALNAVRLACFALSPLLLLAGLSAITRLASTPGEIVIGVLGASSLALLMVILGLVLPPARRRRIETRDQPGLMELVRCAGPIRE